MIIRRTTPRSGSRSSAEVRVLQLRPVGRLDEVAASSLRRELQLLMRSGMVDFVVDLSAVDSVDALGLGVLVTCRKAARDCGGNLLITRPNEQVKTMLVLTNLDRVLKCHDGSDSDSDSDPALSD